MLLTTGRNLAYMIMDLVGTWLRLVEHSVRDAGVGGSNPLVPTIFTTLDGYNFFGGGYV